MLKLLLKAACCAGLLCMALAAHAQDRMRATGIGVSDLDRSTAFYQDVLGLAVLRTYELGYLNEVVLGYPEGNTPQTGAVLVLMNWPNDPNRNYDGNNVKVVFDVADPVATIERIRARGGRIDREATPIEALNGRVVGLGRDPDNYVVEVIER